MLHIWKSNAPLGAPHDSRIMNVEISTKVYINKSKPMRFFAVHKFIHGARLYSCMMKHNFMSYIVATDHQ
jgi:hypothetical protein